MKNLRTLLFEASELFILGAPSANWMRHKKSRWKIIWLNFHVLVCRTTSNVTIKTYYYYFYYFYDSVQSNDDCIYVKRMFNGIQIYMDQFFLGSHKQHCVKAQGMLHLFERLQPREYSWKSCTNPLHSLTPPPIVTKTQAKRLERERERRTQFVLPADCLQPLYICTGAQQPPRLPRLHSTFHISKTLNHLSVLSRACSARTFLFFVVVFFF